MTTAIGSYAGRGVARDPARRKGRSPAAGRTPGPHSRSLGTTTTARCDSSSATAEFARTRSGRTAVTGRPSCCGISPDGATGSSRPARPGRTTAASSRRSASKSTELQARRLLRRSALRRPFLRLPFLRLLSRRRRRSGDCLVPRVIGQRLGPRACADPGATDARSAACGEPVHAGLAASCCVRARGPELASRSRASVSLVVSRAGSASRGLVFVQARR